MSIYLSIANDVSSNKVVSAFVEPKNPDDVQIAEAVNYQPQAEHMTLSRAMAELDELEGDIAAFAANGYKGKVNVTCMFGLAVKLNKAAKGDEIYQDFMDTAEGPWGEYCKRINNVVATAKNAGMILQAVPLQQLTRSEVNADVEKLAKVVDENTIEINGEQYTDGQTVEFKAVKGNMFQRVAGKLVIEDNYVLGERKLRIRMPKTERDRVHITVERFAENTEDKLPDNAYGDTISWLRYATQGAMSALREGRAPKKAAAVA